MQSVLSSLFSKTEYMRSKVRQNKFGESGYCRNDFIKNTSFRPTFPVIPKAQNYRGCMDTKKAIFRNFKERIPSLFYRSCEHQLILFVWFMKAKVYKVESCAVYFALNFHTNHSISHHVALITHHAIKNVLTFDDSHG